MSAPFVGAMIVLLVLGGFLAIDGGIAYTKATTCTVNCSGSTTSGTTTTTYTSSGSGLAFSTVTVTSNFFGVASNTQPYVVINGQTYGPTPFQVSLAFGTYSITCGAVPGFVVSNSPNPSTVVVATSTTTFNCNYIQAGSGSGPSTTFTVSFTECGTLTNGCIDNVPGLPIFLFPPGTGTIGSLTYENQCFSNPECQVAYTDPVGQASFVVPQNSGTWTAYLNDGGFGIVTCTMTAGTTPQGCSLSVSAASLSVLGAVFPGLSPVAELILGIIVMLVGLGFGYAGRNK